MPIAGLSMAGPLIVAACGGFLPTPPYTTRAAESGWGEPVDGLSILLAADTDSVALGGRLRTEVFFRYNPFLAGRTGLFLLGDDRTESWTIVLRDVRTGETWERAAYDPGLGNIAVPYDDARPLGYGPDWSRAGDFILLSGDGEQVPPGAYDATVRYVNDGSPGEHAVLDPTRVQIPEGDPARPLWRGVLETAPLRLRVVDRDADTTRCEIPTALLLTWNEKRGTMEWSWAPDSWENVELVSRPGYHLGCRTEFDWSLGEEPFPEPGRDASREEWKEFREVWGYRTRGSVGNLPSRRHPPAGLGLEIGGPRFPEVLKGGKSVRVVVHLKVFETSVPSGHLWGPELGDYRVLREWDAEGEWP